jgi:hypothetical protein
MSYPPIHPVKPLREHLFQPFHDIRELKPVRRQKIERQPIIRKPQSPELKLIASFRLPEHPGEQRQGVSPPEQRFPIVNAGTYLVPNALIK